MAGRPIKPVTRQFPNRLRELRLARGWSQEQVGELIGLSQTQVGKVERHKHRLQPHLVKKIAEVFGVATWEVVEERDEQHRILLEMFDQMTSEQRAQYLGHGEVLLGHGRHQIKSVPSGKKSAA